jgi:hypothetical protein
MANNVNAAKLCAARLLVSVHIKRLSELARIGANVAASFAEADEQDMSPMDLVAKRVFMDMEKTGHRDRINEALIIMRTIEARIAGIGSAEVNDDVAGEIMHSLQRALDNMEKLFVAAQVADKQLKMATAECN